MTLKFMKILVSLVVMNFMKKNEGSVNPDYEPKILNICAEYC